MWFKTSKLPAPDHCELAIDARGLIKNFGDFRAVDGVDLQVRTGSIFGILGPNGAGKTTTLRMLLGIIEPDSGSRRLLDSLNPLDVAQMVGYLPEERGLYPSMKAVEAIAFMGALRGLSLGEGRKRARALMEEHDLGFAADRQIRQLSKGMAQTVQLLGTFVHQPRLIVLDEPFSGLDALNQQKLERLIRAQADAGVTIIFSTHVIAHAERLCEEIAIIDNGEQDAKLNVELANLEEQRRALERTTDLARSQNVSKSRVDEQTAALRKAEANVAAARARVAVAAE